LVRRFQQRSVCRQHHCGRHCERGNGTVRDWIYRKRNHSCREKWTCGESGFRPPIEAIRRGST